jgi:hypothetical protein
MQQGFEPNIRRHLLPPQLPKSAVLFLPLWLSQYPYRSE